MKVVLLYPGISGIGFNSYGSGMEESWISHGLCSISSYAKKEGYRIELIDLRTLRSWSHLKNIIREKKPDVVGITMMSVDYNPALRSIDIIKRVSPRSIIVVGGAHPTIMLEEVKREEKIDYIITGEGEISFVELLRDIRGGRHSSKVIRGIVAENLNELPFIDRELFRNFEYPVDDFDSPFVTVIAGRGCRYNCSFCQPAERLIFGKGIRRRSPMNIIQELDILRRKYDFKSMMLHDDCITEDKLWVKEFCRLYKEGDFKQSFACQSRADIICENEDMIAIMASSGLKIIFIGFESGNQRVLDFIHKGTKVEQNYRASEICRSYGIKVWANYMLGLPTETKQEVMDTVKMIKIIKPDYYSPAFYTPHPGSNLFEYCEQRNLSLIKNHNSYRRNANEPKIKGIDYGFLYRALIESEGNASVLKRIKVSLERIFMSFLYRHPQLYGIIRGIIKR